MSLLGGLSGREPADAHELHTMAAAAWHRREVACFLSLAEIADPWVRAIVRQEANRQFGRRDVGGGRGAA